MSVASQLFSEVFPPAAGGVPARPAESDDEYRGMVDGRVGQYDLLPRQCLGFSMRNVLRPNTRADEQHHRECPVDPQTIPVPFSVTPCLRGENHLLSVS